MLSNLYKIIFLLISIIVIGVLGCSAESEVDNAVQPKVKETLASISTPTPIATPIPTSTPVPTPIPTPTLVPTPIPTPTPVPTPIPTPIPVPTLIPTSTPVATPIPTPTPMPTPIPTPTPVATPIPTPTPVPTPIPTPTISTSGANWDPLSAAENAKVFSPPNAKAINLEYDAAIYKVQVIGNPGAVPGMANVLVVNMELGRVVLIRAESSGRFETSLPATPGTHILIKQDSTGQMINLNDDIQEILRRPGIILSIPVPETANGYGFAGGGRVSGDGPVWVVKGSLSRINFLLGDKATITGKVSILTSAPIPDDIYYSFYGQMIGDANGLQVGPGGQFISNILTPTGLPILPGTGNSMDIFVDDCRNTPLDWRQEKGKLVADFSCDVQIRIDTSDLKANTPAGTYIIWLNLHVPGTHLETMTQLQTQKLLGMGFNPNSVSLAIATVGSPLPLKLTTTLFADLLQEGTRGGVSTREDEFQMRISPLIITNHNPVIPRLDSYGDLLIHRLDPYIPLLGITDRAPPAVPFIDFDFSNSAIQITVERPDGKTDVLGPTPLAAYGVKTPVLPGRNQIAAGGGHIGEIPQLLAQGDVFEYKFPLDGDYVVELSGQVFDMNGQTFEIAGTYDLTVANSLDIETMLLPGTPFEVGDSLPIGLQVYPGVPADINFTMTHIGADNVTHKREYVGTANATGYWDGEGQFFVFDRAGEYRVDVEARYSNTDRDLWVGRMTYGSAVATPDGPIIAHGRRGKDGLDYIPPPWGFGVDFSADGHLQFPFFTGDILWGIEAPEPNRENGDTELGPGDSVNTGLSFQVVDAEHPLVARVIKQAEQRVGDITPLAKAGQLPLTIAVELNPDGSREFFEGFQPEEFKLLAYAYSSAQRPGVRVREIINGNDIDIGYWRFADAYHMQSGNSPYEGDMPGDFKFLYGATVIRDIKLKEGIFAIYGSGWVLLNRNDPQGSRFMPPFQGNAGGPNGGPLFNVHGRDVDMFFLPLGVRPGSVLEAGDIFRMAGSIMPTLPSKVTYTVTSPDGTSRTFEGQANSIGYYYNPSDDFTLEQSGLWTVELKVIHDGMTSAGPVQEPYPNGGLLTPDGRTFTFVVKDVKTHELTIGTDLIRNNPLNWYDSVNREARFATVLPEEWNAAKAHIIVTMPGIVLLDKDIVIQDGTIEFVLNGKELNQLVSNFDPNLSDTITVTYYVKENSGRQAVGFIVTHGARVPIGSDLPPNK